MCNIVPYNMCAYKRIEMETTGKLLWEHCIKNVWWKWGDVVIVNMCVYVCNNLWCKYFYSAVLVMLNIGWVIQRFCECRLFVCVCFEFPHVHMQKWGAKCMFSQDCLRTHRRQIFQNITTTWAAAEFPHTRLSVQHSFGLSSFSPVFVLSAIIIF